MDIGQPAGERLLGQAGSDLRTPSDPLFECQRAAEHLRRRPDAPVDDAAMTERIDRNSKIQMDIIARKVELAAERVS